MIRSNLDRVEAHIPEEPGEGSPGATVSRRTDANPGSIKRLRLLWENRPLLFRATACGFMLSLALAFLLPIRYEATTQLMPPDPQSLSGLASVLTLANKNGGMGMLAGDLLGMRTSGALFIGILRSHTVKQHIVASLELQRHYRSRSVEDAVRELQRNTQLSEERKSGIISIGVADRNPQVAAAVTKAYVTQLDGTLAQLNTSAAHRERVFLEERLQTVKKDLDAAAKQFSEFASQNNALDIKEQGKTMVEAAASLQAHLIAAQSEMQGLRQIYTDNNVRVRALRARIAELQAKVDQLGGGGLGNEKGGREGRDLPYPSIRRLPLLGVTYADLYRETKVQDTLYEVLTEQAELAKVQEAKETPSVKVLDPAQPPDRRSFPPRSLITFLGTLFAIVAAIVWILTSARWKETDSNHPGKLLVREIYASAAGATLSLRPGLALRRSRQAIGRKFETFSKRGLQRNARSQP